MTKPITYYLESKEKFLPLLYDFINKSIEEEYSLSTDTDVDEISYADFYSRFITVVASNNVDKIFEYCQSPIEKVFLSSFMLLFIKNRFPCLHFTPPANNIEENIISYRENHLAIMALIESYKKHTGDDELQNFEKALLKKKNAGVFNDQQIEEIQVHNNIIRHFEWNSYHITPQAGFPNIKVNGRSIRTDFVIWVPSDEQVKIVVECDGFAYHNSKDSFENDRIRDRQLQSNGYRVIRFSGSEINKDPVKISSDLFDLIDIIDQNTHGNRLL